ncbi:hypothetical protein K160097B7_01940 [[Clostridium] hylemonae]
MTAYPYMRINKKQEHRDHFDKRQIILPQFLFYIYSACTAECYHFECESGR